MEGPRETMRRFAQQGQTDGVRGLVGVVEVGGLGEEGGVQRSILLA